MFVIWGWKKTRKVIGSWGEKQCPHCNSTAIWQILCVTSWFSIFFIPVIPYKKHFFLICPICEHGKEITREQTQLLMQQD